MIGAINICVPQCVSLAAGHFSNAADELAIPSLTESELRGKTGCLCKFYASNAFVGEFNRNAQPGIFNKKPLHFIQRPMYVWMEARETSRRARLYYGNNSRSKCSSMLAMPSFQSAFDQFFVGR